MFLTLELYSVILVLQIYIWKCSPYFSNTKDQVQSFLQVVKLWTILSRFRTKSAIYEKGLQVIKRTPVRTLAWSMELLMHLGSWGGGGTNYRGGLGLETFTGKCRGSGTPSVLLEEERHV